MSPCGELQRECEICCPHLFAWQEIKRLAHTLPLQAEGDAVIEPHKRFRSLWFWFGCETSTTEMDPVIRKFECGHLYMDFINEVTFVLGMRHKDTHTICPGLAWPVSFQMRCLCTHTHTHIQGEPHTRTRECLAIYKYLVRNALSADVSLGLGSRTTCITAPLSHCPHPTAPRPSMANPRSARAGSQPAN